MMGAGTLLGSQLAPTSRSKIFRFATEKQTNGVLFHIISPASYSPTLSLFHIICNSFIVSSVFPLPFFPP